MKSAKQNLPPGPRAWLPIGVFRELRRDPLAFLTKMTRVYGDISTFRSMGQRYVILNHPDLAREVLLTQADAFKKGPALQNSKGILGEGLLTAEGDRHRQQRRMMQPAFHAKHVENYAGDVIESTRAVAEAWGEKCGMRNAQGGNGLGGGCLLEVRQAMMGLTLVIAGKTLFGTMLAGDIETVYRSMETLMGGYVRTVVPWGKLLNHLPLPSTMRLARAQGDLRALVGKMIAARRAELKGDGGHGGTAERGGRDLLSMMIAATDDDAVGDMLSGDAKANGASGCPYAAEHGTRAAEHGIGTGAPQKQTARLTDEQLRDQAITILVASHETTANAMTFTLYLLAKHPEEQKKLREEVTNVLGQVEPTVEMLDRLPRTRWVLSESMRLLPPAWTLGRQNQREIELGGYRLPPKCTILMPQWTLHRDARFWEKPLEFLPERWREPKHPRFAYIPFSTGPRNCIGESFAWLELTLALAMLVREFSFELPAGTPEIRLTPAITLRPTDPVLLHIKQN